MSRPIKRAAALAAVALLAVGCPGGGGSKSTPQETLQTMSSAVSEGNRDQFLSCWKADANQKKLLEAMFDMSSGSLKLKQSITKTYGPDGWKKFAAASQMGDMTDNPLDPEKISKAQVEIKGDQATVSVPGMGEKMTMVKEGGSWLADAKAMPQNGPPPDQMGKMVAAMKGAFDKVNAEVGKAGQTPESLAAKLQTEMMSAMMGAGGPGGPPMPK
jgi:hypothetical protein